MHQLELPMDDEPLPSTQPAPPPEERPRKPRGFASMDPERVREIARRGGRAAQLTGKAHRFTSEEARAAGKKGGSAHHICRGRGKRT